jgi:hypothetical protein
LTERAVVEKMGLGCRTPKAAGVSRTCEGGKFGFPTPRRSGTRREGKAMNATRRRRPQVEPLEDRTVLSAGHGLALVVHPPVVHHAHHARHRHHHAHPGKGAAGQQGHGSAPSAAAQQVLALGGQVSGVWQTDFPLNPDVGQGQMLRGGGIVSPLGTVQMTGHLHMPGFIAQGQAVGTVTLSNAAGSVTLQLVGPPEPGFGPPPATFQYTITGGTGQYAGATSSGTVVFEEHPEARPVCPPGTPCPQFIVAASFTMTFLPAAG